jgi:hypothetical protein
MLFSFATLKLFLKNQIDNSKPQSYNNDSEPKHKMDGNFANSKMMKNRFSSTTLKTRSYL